MGGTSITPKTNAILQQIADNTANLSAEKQLILPITDFVESGAFDYLLTKVIHGINIINSVEVGSNINTLSAITNYTIAPNGDLTINTNAQLITEIVRITGNY